MKNYVKLLVRKLLSSAIALCQGHSDMNYETNNYISSQSVLFKASNLDTLVSVDASFFMKIL